MLTFGVAEADQECPTDNPPKHIMEVVSGCGLSLNQAVGAGLEAASGVTCQGCEPDGVSCPRQVTAMGVEAGPDLFVFEIMIGGVTITCFRGTLTGFYDVDCNVCPWAIPEPF